MSHKFYSLILLAALFTGSVSGCGRQSYHQTGYVPWGLDEFELFGLAKPELGKKVEGKFHSESSELSWKGAARFHITFDKDGKVETVQRMFIDGAGCNLTGPLLTSKKEALEFSVDGLSNLEHLDQGDQSKLATAQALLKEISK